MADIGPLGQTSFVTETPTPCFADIISISCWFFADRAADLEVLASVGNKSIQQPGWTLYRHRDELRLRVNHHSDHSVEISASLAPSGDHWQHAVAIIERTSRSAPLQLFINGIAGRNKIPQIAQERIEPESVSADQRLIVGGYSDDAGGHFDHRFGRSGIGLIDQFRVYQRALTAAEVSILADANGADLTPPAQAIAALHATPVPPPSSSVPVFVNGCEGYSGFRIPAIVRAMNGDLLAFAEGRRDGLSDATSVIHIVCKRSSDGGRSWSPLVIVAKNRSLRDNDDREYACMNPAPVVDTLRGSGRVVVVYSKMEYSEWAISQGQGVSRVCCIFSDDHGRTWVNEQDITLQVHKPYNPSYIDVYANAARPANRSADWRKQVPTLGHAIQIHHATNPSLRGRLFYIGCYSEADDAVFFTRNYAFWSDDLGVTWQTGNAILWRQDGSSAKGLSEATAAELDDGSIIVNSRNYQHGKVVGHRAVTLGQFDATGAIQFQATRHDTALIDTGVQASLLSYRASEPSNSVLLFANPADPKARRRLTLRLSYDQGQTWVAQQVIDPGPAAYSDMLALDNGGIGLFYERGNHGGLWFARVALAELTST